MHPICWCLEAYILIKEHDPKFQYPYIQKKIQKTLNGTLKENPNEIIIIIIIIIIHE
jgi:hypothetical protein